MSNKHGIIRLRRGTAAEWTASEPQPGGEVLRLGEPGYEKDTGKLKIGDGVTPWNSLVYFNAGATIDPEDIEDILGDGFLVAGTGININYNDLGNNLTISTSGVSFDGHSHIISDVSGLQNALDGVNDVVEVADYEALLSTVGASGTIYVTLDDNKIYRYVSSPYSVQLGNDIDGQSAGDFSGYSVSLNSNGTILAVGAPDNADNGNDSGNVRVYVWNGNSWIQRGSDIDGEASYNYSGYSVAVNNDGNILAIGAYGNNTNTGHVRVYSWNGTIWTQLGTDIDGEAIGDYSGISVNLNNDGNILAIGAYFNDGNGSNSGHVRVYSWNGSSWIQLGVDIDGEAADDRSGISVSLSSDGNILAIGATRNDDNGSNSGHVRVYVWNGILWVQRGSDIDGEATNDFSGYSVSLNSNGNILAIGAIYNDGNGGSGHVRVYAWNGSSWIQRGNDIDGEAANDRSGISVSLSSDGNILAIGANGNDDNGADSGHVRVYYWDGSSWIQLGNDINGEAANDNSGISVSLNSDGNILAIGAIFNDGNTDYDSGHVRVYNLIGPYVELSRYPSEHVHVSTDITDFNSSVSGLLPVKDIVGGTDINISSSSGIYTINSSNTVNTDTKEPDGFVNRSDSTISFDDSSRIFTIAPTGVSYSIYNNGVKVVKSSSESVTLPDTTALYYIHFDKSDNSLSYKTTAYNFVTDIPIAHIYYNADDNKAVYFGEERHGIVMDSATHKYLHTVFGTQYINGLSISNYSTSGDGSLDSDATIAIGDGLIYDEDIDVNITHSDTPSNPFEQVLYPVAVIPVYYKVGSSGVWTDSTATNFPVKVDTTIQYNLNSAGTWSASNSDAPNNNRFIASWICATSQENAPIIAIMGQRIDSSLEQATSNNSWGNLNLNGLPVVELRPLYRLIYDTKSSFANGAKGFLVNVLDIRSHIDTITGLPQNDHGNLYGLADDDHYQYVHINEARTIDAVHTFTNGLISNDNITVSGINVSLDGHQHVSADITDFNSSVSGLFPAFPYILDENFNILPTNGGNSVGVNAGSSVVGGGDNNTVSGSYAVVGGGKNNNAQSYASTISGGDTNTASAYFSAIGGGEGNVASGYDAVIGGGRNNSASSNYSVICGGNVNNVSNVGSFIGGGSSNTNSGYHGVICGGINNTASGYYAVVSGGKTNAASGQSSVISGGDNNGAGGDYSAIGGGYNNTSGGDSSVIGGGHSNFANADYSVVGGGRQNTVEGTYAGISAGSYNSIPIGSDYTFIGGGKNNTAIALYSVVCGGRYNTATDEGFVGGGSHNTASALYATVIGGGNYNSATNFYASICGGNNNTASGPLSSIGGGGSNTASAYYSTVSGGNNNNASAIGSTISGGLQAKADRYGMQAYSAGSFASDGDAQRVNFILRQITSDDTPTELFLDSNSIKLTIPSGKALFATVSIAGIINGGSKAIHYIRKVAIKNISGTTSLIGTVSTLGTDVEDDASYDVSIAADNTNDALQINVTGKTGETIRWVAHVDGIEIAYG